MQSKVSICNIALANIGQAKMIASLSEQSTAARLCSLFLPQVIDEFLTLPEHPWPFARKVVRLALLSEDPPPGWRFAYAYPADCVFAIRISTESGARKASRSRFGTVNLNSFEVMSGASGRIIVTDLEDAFLHYTERVDEMERYPPLAALAISWMLAARLAMPLSADQGLAGNAQQQAEIAVNVAAVSSMLESDEDVDPVTPSIQARF